MNELWTFTKRAQQWLRKQSPCVPLQYRKCPLLRLYNIYKLSGFAHPWKQDLPNPIKWFNATFAPSPKNTDSKKSFLLVIFLKEDSLFTHSEHMKILLFLNILNLCFENYNTAA